jgi:hypothetical protein
MNRAYLTGYCAALSHAYRTLLVNYFLRTTMSDRWWQWFDVGLQDATHDVANAPCTALEQQSRAEPWTFDEIMAREA